MLLLTLGVLCVVIAPVVTVIATSLSTSSLGAPGEFTLQNYSRLLSSRAALEQLTNTVVFVVGSTALSVSLGGLLAWIVSCRDLPYRRAMRLLPAIGLLIPSLLRLSAWVQLYSPRTGVVNIGLMNLGGFQTPPFDIYSMLGMIVVEGTALAPIPFLILLGPFEALDGSLLEVSRTLGAGRLRIFRRVVLPLLTPAVVSAFALTAIIAAQAFEIPVLLGASAGIQTYMSAIYVSLARSSPDYNLASAQAMVYLAFTCALLLWYWLSTRRERRFVVLGGRGSRSVARLGRWRYVGVAIVLGYFFLSSAQLLIITALISLVPFYTLTSGNPFASLSLDNYAQVLGSREALPAIAQSLQVALFVAVVTIGVATVLAYVSYKTRARGRRLADILGTLPIAIPPLVFSVALLMTVLSTPPLRPFYSTLGPMLIALLIVLLPLPLRIVSSAMIQINDDMLEASAMSGARGLRTVRRILLPLLTTSIVSALVLVFIQSFRELASIALLVTPGTYLFPALIFSEIENPATGWGGVSALNIVSILVPLAVVGTFMAVRRLVAVRTRRPSEPGNFLWRR